jgi:selenocysteine-specific elongation factor
LIEASERPLRHNDDVVVFAGSAEIPAKAALLDCDSIEPGSVGWVQLRLARPAAVLARDRFILRRPSPAETIGGGEVFVLDPPRHKRFQATVVDRLNALTAGEPGDLAMAWLGDRFVGESELRNAVAEETIAQLEREERIRLFGGAAARIVAAAATVDDVSKHAVEAVSRYHVERPLEAGMPRELLRQSVGLTRPVFDVLIDATAELEVLDAVVRRTGFAIRLDETQHEIVAGFCDALRRGGFQPGTPDEAGIPSELVQAMIAMGQVVSVGDGIVFLPDQIAVAETQLRAALAQGNSISLAEYRDVLGTTRKYAQALLEYFDRQRVTRRVGDRRVAIGPATARESDQPR